MYGYKVQTEDIIKLGGTYLKETRELANISFQGTSAGKVSCPVAMRFVCISAKHLAPTCCYWAFEETKKKCKNTIRRIS
jgi:hypothetical protein